jgi:hypothetical protein
MAKTRTRQSLHKQYKKKKKKKTDWKGKPYPVWTEGETNEEHHDKVTAWKKANPDKKIPDSPVFYLDDPGPIPPTRFMDMPESMKDPRRIERHHKTGKITEMGAASGGSIKKGDSNYYAHGGSVRKTKLNDY